MCQCITHARFDESVHASACLGCIALGDRTRELSVFEPQPRQVMEISVMALLAEDQLFDMAL